MASTSSYQLQTPSRASSQGTAESPDAQEMGKKPKKVNSEIRKQQNRIASRNYREKRKRKLQYLQQLLDDGESPERAAQVVQETEREQMETSEYHAQRQPVSVFTLPSNTGFQTLGSSSSISNEPMLSTTAMPHNRQFSTPSPNYTAYQSTWDTAMYEQQSNASMSSWNIPMWMPNVDYTPSVSSAPEDLYTPPPHTHNTFEELPTPPQQSRTPDPELFILGSYGQNRRFDGQQTTGISNACLPSSVAISPYVYTRYTGPA